MFLLDSVLAFHVSRNLSISSKLVVQFVGMQVFRVFFFISYFPYLGPLSFLLGESG